ncbi:unnamed protein product [Urochloa humidicola]
MKLQLQARRNPRPRMLRGVLAAAAIFKIPSNDSAAERALCSGAIHAVRASARRGAVGVRGDEELEGAARNRGERRR